MEFWDAYRKLRADCIRPEEVAVGAEVSIHTVRSWDMTAAGSDDVDHKRNPSHYNRVRLARFAETRGMAKKVVDALKPESPAEVRA